MKLNPDCIRVVLLCVESSKNYDGSFLFRFSNPLHDFLSDSPLDTSTLSINSRPELSGFTEDEVRYHIKQCYDSGLIDMPSNFVPDNCLVNDLTPAGHKFLAEIREEENWSHIKKLAAKVGCFSLDALAQISTNYISSLLT